LMKDVFQRTFHLKDIFQRTKDLRTFHFRDQNAGTFHKGHFWLLPFIDWPEREIDWMLSYFYHKFILRFNTTSSYSYLHLFICASSLSQESLQSVITW
jgi:hypothetical protein